MKSNAITAAIGMVDDDIVAEAANAGAVRRNPVWLRMGVAAACAVCVLGSAITGACAYFTPTSYVSLDVNPSIEYSLNTFDRVLSVKGVNDDGKIILEKIELTSLKNKAIDQAVRETIDAIAQQGYFPKDSEGDVVIAVSGTQPAKAEKLSAQLKAAVKRAAEEEALDVEVESMAVGAARVEEARRLGVTPGKLNLVEKLKESAQNADDIDIEEWLNKSVKDIMKETKANKARSKVKESDAGKSGGDSPNGNEDSGSGKSGKAGKSSNADKPDKAAGKSSDKTNNSNSGGNAKSDNAAKKDSGLDKTDTADNGNGVKTAKSGNNGQSKKSDNQTDSDEDNGMGEASEAGSGKGNNTGKSNNSGKSNSSGKDKSAKK